MTTTIHVPAKLLDRIDSRAKALGVSRNRVILTALEASLAGREDWPPELIAMLTQPPDAKTADLFDATMRAALKRRSRPRRAPRL